MEDDKRRTRARNYYQLNRERIAAARRRHYLANRERLVELRRRYYAQNREEILARQRDYTRAYYRANRKKWKAYAEKRRRKLAGEA